MSPDLPHQGTLAEAAERLLTLKVEGLIGDREMSAAPDHRRLLPPPARLIVTDLGAAPPTSRHKPDL